MTTELIGLARTVTGDDWSTLAHAADQRTLSLVEGFVHQAGPPPAAFAWVTLGSHARAELHCASDQDHALIWADDVAAASSYAADLAAEVISGLERFGLRRCSGGYMADSWSRSLDDWVALLRERIAAPTPEAVLDTDVFLDLRQVAGALDVAPAAAVLRSGAHSTRLMHGLARAANSFGVPLHVFGWLPREIDVKRAALAPTVLLGRLYGLRAGSTALRTVERLGDAAVAGVLGQELADRLSDGFQQLTTMRIRHQLHQADAGSPLSDVVTVAELTADDRQALRDTLRAVKAAQSATGLTFRTDLDL